ncbi:MAG: hypothetical protein QF745_06510, partial [Planctomycetota bacterium]|nr:hypothetical protein [Planctomycetota bacterium]
MTHTQAENKTQMIICEDNEAVIKICLKGRSQALRHLHRTHRVAVDWIYDMIKANWVVLEHVNTKVQIADIFTKAIVKSESWLQLTDLAQIRAAQSGKPPKIDLVKKPKKKKIESDTGKEQVSPTPKAKSKAKSKKGSAKNRVAVATVLTAAAVNLIGCQFFTLSRIDGIVETFMNVEAQAWKHGRASISAPNGSFTAESMEPRSGGMPGFVWLREAQRAQERLTRPPEGDQELQRQTLAAAEGEPGVEGTPAAVEPPEAHAATFSQRLKGAAGELSQNAKTAISPRSQALNTNPERAADPKAEPSLGGTPAQATPSGRADSRSLLNSQLRANLQALHGTRARVDPSPLGRGNVRGGRPPTPPPGPVFSPRVTPVPTPMSERPMNIVAM